MLDFIIGVIVGAFVAVLICVCADGTMRKFCDGWIERKNCQHEWKLLKETRYSDGPDSCLYVCTRCGKMKQKRV